MICDLLNGGHITNKVLRCAKDTGGRFSELFYAAPFRFCLISSLLTNILVEMLCRHSFAAGFKFIIEHPVMFAVGWGIILFTFSFSWLLKKGIVMWATFFIIWFGLALTNCIILIYRAAPLSGSDFAILGSVLPIIGVYLTPFQIVLAAFGICAAIVFIVFLWIKAPKREINFKRGMAAFLVFVLLIAAIIPSLFWTEVLPRDFSDINRAYAEYGFTYGFLCSIFAQGINKPDNYSEVHINSILERLNAAKSDDLQEQQGKRPNVIYVQLESFFDISAVRGLELPDGIIPNFTALKNSFPSGYLSVPLVGAGTANTEFEILTGMNIDYFGGGEYPYETVLDDTTCESVAYLYSKYGYKTHAMHNNTGTFYGRDTVYSNLGFDTFTPIECMYGIEYNALEWAKDTCLTEQIKETLFSTEEKDFIFTVSVQAHGKYPEELLGNVSDYCFGLDDIGGLETERLKNMYLYYINEIKGTDTFIGELLEFLKDFSEETVVVFYGDHLPYLELEANQLTNGDLLQTEYIVWSNYGLEESASEAENIEAYQLSSYVFGLLGLDGGIMSDIHAWLRNEADYQNILENVEYDLLYGEKYAYGDTQYVPTDIAYGIRETQLTSVDCVQVGDKTVYSVKGANFNKFSRIYINGKSKGETEYISENELKISVDILDGDRITVVQVSDDGKVFRSTSEYRIATPLFEKSSAKAFE